MIYVNHDDEIVDYGKEHTFTYGGEEYIGYTRTLCLETIRNYGTNLIRGKK